MSGSTQTPPIGFKTPVREAVGIFARQQDLQAAIDDLLTSGFARCELSLRGTETEATAGRTPEALADDPAAPRTDHFCTEALGDAEGSLIGGFAVLPALGAAWAGALQDHRTLAGERRGDRPLPGTAGQRQRRGSFSQGPATGQAQGSEA